MVAEIEYVYTCSLSATMKTKSKTIGIIFQMIIALLVFTQVSVYAEKFNAEDTPLNQHLTVFVDLSEQKASVTDDTNPEKPLKEFEISSGRTGKETLNGTYLITSMKESDYSDEYKCDMNWCSRLKNSSTGEVKGYALHEGMLHKVNIPSSGGCLRMPSAVAKEVYKLIHSAWSKNHDAVRIVVAGDSSQVAKRKLGELMEYDSKGKPLRYSRTPDGKLADVFYEQRSKLTLFCQDSKTGKLLDKSEWTLGTENIKDRVKVTEYEQRFGQTVSTPKVLATRRPTSKKDD